MFRYRTYMILFLIITIIIFTSEYSLPTHAAPNVAIVVNTLNDDIDIDGYCSLREAIIASNLNSQQNECPGGDSSIIDTITFNLSGTIVLGFDLPHIQNSGSLVIDGGNQITISGDDKVRVFYVENNANLTLKNLKVSKGYVLNGIGAGLYNDQGTVSIQDCIFEYNKASGDAYPGGGAIYSFGGPGLSLTISDTTFSNNQSSLQGGAIAFYGSNQGAIYNSTFLANSALNGGAIYADYSELEINGTTFQNNYAIGPSTDSEYGGAMYLFDTNVLIMGSTFRANGADAGGGIFATYKSELQIEGTLMTQNQTQIGGGSILTGALTDLVISQSVFDSNVGGSRGGAIDVTQSESGDSRILDSTFTGNSANRGGAIYGDLLNGIIARNTFYNNTAYQDGGVLYSMSSVGPDYSDLQLANNTLSGNNANTAGAIYNSDSKVTLMNNTLMNNYALSNALNLYNDPLKTGVLSVHNSIIMGHDSIRLNCFGAITDGGYNVDQGSSCGFDTTNGSLNDTDAILGTLKDNGGSTHTHALLTGSPAINAANRALCPDFDQRDFSRRTGYCDIGAFEAQPATIMTISGSDQSTMINTDFPNPLVAEALDEFNNRLGGVVITFTNFASGAGISNSGGSMTSNSDGRVAFQATANSIVGGPYQVTASSDSLSTGFSLTNLGYPTTTSITNDSPDPSESGQTFKVDFSVSATQGRPTGSVDITVSGIAENCSGNLNDGVGSCQLKIMTPGKFKIIATYSGDSSFASSTTLETHEVVESVKFTGMVYLPLLSR